VEQTHWAAGFKPRDLPGLHNGLIDPAEMIVRGFHLWQQTRWPGRAGRVHWAHTLFNLYLVRCLALSSMRLWDAGPQDGGTRLSEVQRLLDRLWATSPADQPVFVRDARWLIQLAQSPATDDLGAYFDVAQRIAELRSGEDRIEIHKAGACLAAGHLRSQIRYYSLKNGVPLDDAEVVSTTRRSNALDFALLIQDLVPLLAAYEDACHSRDNRKRLALADAICQGVSPDPDLFLNRVELLGAYSMVEHLFVTTNGDGRAAYTAMGRRHVRLLEEYATRIAHVSPLLDEDCPRFRPGAGTYSPYGLLYGFASDLLEHMALKALQPDAERRFCLEDVFVSGEAGADKLAWVNGWRRLPHVAPEVTQRFAYPQQFAEDLFARLEGALRRRVAKDETKAAARTGTLVVVPRDGAEAAAQAPEIPDLPVRYVGSSDVQRVEAHSAEFRDEAQILSDQREGRCLVSYATPGGLVAISKALLTDVLGEGRDVKIAGLPPEAVDTLTLMCPTLVVRPPHARS
jgi:hypothetical protein